MLNVNFNQSHPSNFRLGTFSELIIGCTLFLLFSDESFNWFTHLPCVLFASCSNLLMYNWHIFVVTLFVLHHQEYEVAIVLSLGYTSIIQMNG